MLAMATTDVSESDYIDIVNRWKETPLNASEFAAHYTKVSKRERGAKRPTRGQVEAVVRGSLAYALRGEAPRPSGGTETSTLYGLYRGSLMFLDSAYITKGYIGCPWYILVCVDAYSRCHFFQEHKRLSAKSTAEALAKILLRFGTTPRKVISDRGTEVGISLVIISVC